MPRFSEIRHIFFDLDHTLWDFDRNAAACLDKLFITNNLPEIGVPDAAAFIRKFNRVNQEYWRRLEANEITHEYLRNERFGDVIRAFGVELPEGLSLKMNDDFLRLLSEQSLLIEGCLETLDALTGRYGLHIISNGFDEIQRKKAERSGINAYFTHFVTFSTAQARKPDRRIFDAAIQLADAPANHCLMVGDSLDADILGALNAGMQAVWFAPAVKVSPRSGISHIKSLPELLTLL